MRYMPQKYTVIATKTESGEVHLYDYSQYPQNPESETPNPTLKLLGN